MKVAVYRNKEKIMLQVIEDQEQQQDIVVSVTLQQGMSSLETWELVEEFLPISEENIEVKLYELMLKIYEKEGVQETSDKMKKIARSMLGQSIGDSFTQK